MFPVCSTTETTGIAWRDSQISCYIAYPFAVSMPFNRFLNGVCGEFALAMAFAFCFVLSSFSEHVSNIVSVCANEEMVRTNADRVVAFMAYEHPIRDNAIVKLPTVAMCSNRLSFYGDFAISIYAKMPCPIPASIGLGNFLPESTDRVGCKTRARAIDNSACVARFDFELFAATLTTKNNRHDVPPRKDVMFGQVVLNAPPAFDYTQL